MFNIEKLNKLKEDAKLCVKYGCEKCNIDCVKYYGNIPPEDIWKGLLKSGIVEACK